MNERMTWKEIKEKYPNQWVGLDDVEWNAPDGATVVSAVVRYTDKTKSELTKMQIETKGKIIACHTDPDAHAQMGAIGWFEGITCKVKKDG